MLDQRHSYVFRVGSDNQIHLRWDGRAWVYEFLAGGVLFDSRRFPSEESVAEALAEQGLSIRHFTVDTANEGVLYSAAVQEKMKRLTALGVEPCPKHGLLSKNEDNTCEACLHADYPDDFKGTEG